ncbi:MAG: bacterial transcriptional activator domain-containing protein [Chloroflexi bacterium]|nr:bacterial transcriptional activator domain-containing protein [Chloroflexota bacterium]
MLPHVITSISFESFRASSAGKKVILLYPWANHRNIFLSYFLNDLSEGLLYFRLPERTSGLANWLRRLVEEIRHVEASFGQSLEAILANGRPSEIGEALANDLARLEHQRVVLYLDELDRIPQDEDFRQFMNAAIANLPDKAQLAINSRLLTYDPWISWVNRDEVVVLGTEHRSSNLLFAKATSLKPQLEVYAFGRGHALSNGREISSWDGALPRNLFFYFIDNPLVTRDQIFEIFWPKLSVRDATNVFHVTKRKITERISVYVDDGANYELTAYSTGFYAPSDKIVRHYDVADFEQAMEGALLSYDARERELLYLRAIEIYKAPFLHPVKLPWVEARRNQLKSMYAEALIGMARLKTDRGAWDEALGYYARALKEVPQREDIHRGAMQMYINLGRNADARQQYKLLERMLRRKLGVKPSGETRALIEQLV